NSFGGRFPTEELQRLSELMIDSPVLVGHRKDRLPVGRTFFAEVVSYENKTWVKSYFYWLRSAEGAQTLKENIDGGIYKECSVGFTFQYPECSVCGEDIRRCEHEPFEQYRSAAGDQTCHFLYRQVERVLESSLVYRGAVHGTSVTKDLTIADLIDSSRDPIPLAHPAELDMNGRYLVTPMYHGIDVTVSCTDNVLTIAADNGSELSMDRLRMDTAGLNDFSEIPGLLIGMRGKGRCSVEELTKFIQTGKGPVSRVILKLYPTLSDEGCFAEFGQSSSVSVIGYELVTVDQVAAAAHRLMTAQGVRVWKSDDVRSGPGFLYTPKAESAPSKTGYTLIVSTNTGDAGLCFYCESHQRSFLIRQFSLSRFRKGGRYLCDEAHAVAAQAVRGSYRYAGDLQVQNRGESFVLSLDGSLNETAVLQPIRINGLRRFLFYRANPNTISDENSAMIILSEDEDVHQE
ncbi:MAG TPA: hypothetical protein VJ983_00715, partial [candidate division Zixibacteria bacterium]|nr:hypothetical protein [candidate division Zixibacteria bacterium]